MRGRKPKATVLKLLAGNPGQRPLNPHEPDPAALDPACPPELEDPIAKAEWDRTIAPAIQIGQITGADRALAIAHCAMWALWRGQLSDGKRHANVIAVGQHKYPRPNPALMMAGGTLKALVKIDEVLGLSPTSRTRVQVKGPKSTVAVDKQRAKFLGMGRG